MVQRKCIFLPIIFLLCAISEPLFGASQFNVGPGHEFNAIGEVPWEELSPGDRVNIHWRNTPYREKWVIGRSGTEEEPIIVSGVPNHTGNLPIIEGNGATTRQALNFWNEKRGLIKIGGSNIPSEEIPSHIVIENLELRSARPPYTFTNDSGGVETYAENAASFYVEIGQHITIRNCILHNSGNGIFIGSNGGRTQNILIEGNYIYNNGIENSIYEHNTYTAAIGIVYQNNFMGALRQGAGGNNLKDRSAGLVVRYNWIENGNRQLDLVDAENNPSIIDNPVYRKTYVYGNILKEEDGQGNSQIIHYGGDSNQDHKYRKGTLYLYNNTIISKRTGNTTLVRLSTGDEFADAFNNIFYTEAEGSRFALLSSSGEIRIRNNWIKPGWKPSHSFLSGNVVDDDSSIEGNDPGFKDITTEDYHLSDGASVINQGIGLEQRIDTNYLLLSQYKYHRQTEPRPYNSQLDIGAFEYGGGLMGDTDGNGSLELHDAILALQLMSNIPPPTQISKLSDVDGDSKIGMVEALYIIQQLTTPRP